MKRAQPPLSHGVFSLIGLSQQGLCRPTNEDRYLIKALPEACVLTAVADGLSGAGAWAAQTTIDKLASIAVIAHGEELPLLRRLVLDLDREVNARNFSNGEFQGKGSTLVCALLRRHRLYWVHVGDSRLYLWRERTLTQITQDQTRARLLLKEGEISARQLPKHYSRHVLDQYIGCGHCEPETGMLEIWAGDQFLLCSDGLHRTLAPADLRAAFNMRKSPIELAGAMMAAAIRDGAADDITLVVCRRKADP